VQTKPELSKPEPKFWVLRGLEETPDVVIVSDQSPVVQDDGGLVFQDAMVFFRESMTDQPVTLERWIERKSLGNEPFKNPTRKYSFVAPESLRGHDRYLQTYNAEIRITEIA
jgi:hypothetical protein